MEVGNINKTLVVLVWVDILLTIVLFETDTLYSLSFTLVIYCLFQKFKVYFWDLSKNNFDENSKNAFKLHVKVD